MSDPVGDLLHLMDLERLEVDLFRGQSPENETNQRVFGGQVISQSLVAAYRTVDTDTRTCHSLHAYFLRPGDMNAPIVFEVDRIRDGGSFTTRIIMKLNLIDFD
ncbi:MAG: acyl-CoA thioesterase domain-containing protein [Pseudomonadota bacterium]|nr:acyl-CoA thioesterase domain-containing protein [Pseudomonadota bacterium]